MKVILQMFTITGKASLLFTAIYFLLVVTFYKFLPRTVGSTSKAVIILIALVVPVGLTAWWLLRKLQTQYSKRVALPATIAFAVVAPLALAMGLVLGPITGSYSDLIVGTDSRAIAFAGAFGAIVLVIALMTFLSGSVILWITRDHGRSK